MAPKKILFFFPDFGYGGSERSFLELIRHLDRNKFQIGVCLVGYRQKSSALKHYKDSFPNDVELLALPMEARWRYELIPMISAAYRTAKGYNLLVDAMGFVPFFISVIVSLLTKKDLVVIIRSNLSQQLFDPRILKGTRIQKISLSVEKQILRHLKNIITVSQGVRNDLIKNFKVRTERIQVIYNLLDCNFILRQSKESVSDFFETNKRHIVAVGRLEYEKNYPLLLKAFSRVRQSLAARLIILGNGSLESQLSHLAEELGIAEDVIFTGFQENPYKFISRSELLVLSSVYEGFARVLIEAMACGTPVVSCDCPSGPSEVIQSGENGILVPVGDEKALAGAIIKVLTDEPLRQKLRQNGLERAKDFEASKIVRQYEDYFLKTG